jgi:serine/threonine protein phosphatase PrpC
MSLLPPGLLNFFTLPVPVAEPVVEPVVEPVQEEFLHPALAKLEFLVAPVITLLLAFLLAAKQNPPWEWDMGVIPFALFAIVSHVSWNQYCRQNKRLQCEKLRIQRENQRENQRTQWEKKVVDLTKLALDKILLHWSKTRTPVTENFLKDEIINHHLSLSTWSPHDQCLFVQVEFPIVKALLVSTAFQAQVITSVGVDHTFQWEWKYANYGVNGQKVDGNEPTGDSGAVPEAAETAAAPKGTLQVWSAAGDTVPVGSRRLESALDSSGLHSPPRHRNDGLPSTVQSPGTLSLLDTDSPLQQRVLSAVKKNAEQMESRSSSMEERAFRLCLIRKPLEESERLELKTMIEKTPRLLTSRACTKTTGRDVDNHTMFMVAAYANNVAALQVIWDYVASNPDPTNGVSPEDLLKDTNMKGWTALHVAGNWGCLEAMQFMMDKLNSLEGAKAQVPRDVMSRTPVGLAVLAPKSKVSGHSSIIEQYATDTDKSFIGSPVPVEQRVMTLSSDDNRAQAGISVLAGRRVLMEDYIFCRELPTALLLSVCDGHDDRRLVSEFVAKGVVWEMEQKMNGSSTDSWQEICSTACLDVDDKLKIENLSGGSTGIFAIVTKTEIIVANVGDCRGRLVQFKSEKAARDFLSDSHKFIGSDKDDPVACQDIISTIPLSMDHKPSLPAEEKRVIESGLKVVKKVVLLENGQNLTIHKVLLRKGVELAMSRSFGDFEFKANPNIGRELQAVIANPDVRVQKRCSIDAFVILASDGIWDVMSDEQVAAFVTMRIHHHLTNSERGVAILPTVADELLDHCFLKKGAKDNLSVVIAALSTVADQIADFSGPTADRIADLSGSTAKLLCFDAQT